jgi:L-asparaginase
MSGGSHCGQESQNNGRDLGAIGLDHQGTIAWGKTSEVLLAAYHTGEKMGDTLDWEGETLVDFIA